MTTDRELMQQALDALFNLRWAASERDKKNRIRQFDEFMDGSDEAIEALRARLAQPEQKPVAWGIANTRPTEKNPLIMVMLDEPEPSHLVVPLYAAPPQREWQGLTDEDIRKLSDDCAGVRDENEFIRAIEAKLKEKNND